MTIKSKALHIFFFSLLINLSYAKTYQEVSNDPNGNAFIGKSIGDISSCGPIAALMAVKYTNERFYMPSLVSSIRAARAVVKPKAQYLNDKNEEDTFGIGATTRTHDTRWWRTSDIKSYFKINGVKHHSLNVRKGQQALLNELNKGNILIVNLNMNDMPRGYGNVGKPYFTFPIPGGWGHYLVVVGYKHVDDKLVFETHDSFSKSGKNRMFKASNLIRAVNRYNPQAIVVHK